MEKSREPVKVPRRSSRTRPLSASRDFPTDTWRVREVAFDRHLIARNETIFALGNGHLGMRGNFEEGFYNAVDGTYVNGFFEELPIEYPEPAYGYARNRQIMLNVADPKPIRLFVDGEPFDLRTGSIDAYERVLDLCSGILTRTVRWRSPRGIRVDVVIRRLVSFVRPDVAAIEYAVAAPEGARLRFVSFVDGTRTNQEPAGDPRIGARIGQRPLVALAVEAAGGRGVLVAETVRTKLRVAVAVEHDATAGVFDGRVDSDVPRDAGKLAFELPVEARPGEPVRVTKYIACSTSLTHGDVALAETASLLAAEAKRSGFETLAAEQANALDAFWAASDIQIDGDDALQQGIRFNLFCLLQSAGRDGRTSIAAKGLSGEGYEGHYFWDTETYALPFFIYTQPSIARSLLAYRCSTIPKARARARELGHRGVLFPWRTIGGEETSPYYPAGTAQYHIDADIAFALAKYVDATGDRSLLTDGCGAELLFETARFWCDLGDYIPDRSGEFCLNEVTGPDEYTALVNNDLYTNAMAKWNLERAAATADALATMAPEAFARITASIGLESTEIDEWRHAAEHMRLPYDRNLGVHAQDDVFLSRARWDFEGTPAEKYPLLLNFHPLNVYRFQVLKQPDVVLAQVLLSNRFGLADKRRNFAYYDPLTTGDSSLAPCIQSIAAAELGRTEEAYGYFTRTARMDLDDVGGNTEAGVHTAAMAGTWMSLVYGFAGMRDQDGALSFDPRLPAQITCLRFRLEFQGRRLQVTVTPRNAVYELLSGQPLALVHRGRSIEVAADELVTVSLKPNLEGVVFDLDGVLTNTAEYHFLAWARLAADQGWPFDRAVNERQKGVSRLVSLDILLEHAGVQVSPLERLRLAERKNEYFRELIAGITPADLLPGIPDLLRNLRSARVRVAIASMSHNVWEIVRRLELSASVDAIVDPATLVKGKPDPEVFLRGAEMLGLPPENCAGVEDARVGVQAIKAAGMYTVGIGVDLPEADWCIPDTRELTLEALRRRFDEAAIARNARLEDA